MNKIKHTACFAISPFLLKLTFLLEHSHNYAEGSRIDLRFSSNWFPGAADGLACENSRVSPRSSPLDTRLAGCVGGGGGGICGGQRVRPQVNFALYSLSSATEFLYWWLKSMENSKSRHSTKRRGRVRKMVVYERIQSENFDWENSKDLSGSLIWVISFRCWSYTWRFDWALIPRMFVSLSYNTKWVNRHHHQFVNKKEHWAQNWALGKTSWTFQKVWLRPVNPETNRFRLPWIP